MHVLVIGATGRTGRQVVIQALGQGHGVTALVRNPVDIRQQDERLKVIHGDVLDYPSVESAMQGQDAVVSALGARTHGRTTVLSEGTKNIIRAMEQQKVRRFVCESSLGVGDSAGQMGWLFDWLVLPLWLRHVYRDKEVQEQAISKSKLNWVIVRPALLTNGPKTGVYQAGLKYTRSSIVPRISRADVADFMLKQLTDDAYLRKAPALWY
jgi:putative NADH-flavin reductase